MIPGCYAMLFTGGFRPTGEERKNGEAGREAR
jgi:hypothetical protein